MIRPIFGRGNTQALYQGTIEDNAVVLNENKVAISASFWDYIEAQIRARRDVGTAEGGIYSWRLALTYLDQSGAVAIVDRKPSYVTSVAYEFYRVTGAAEDKDQTTAALLLTFEKMVAAQTQMITTVSANLADNIQKAVSAAVSAAMAPLVQVTDRVAQMARKKPDAPTR